MENARDTFYVTLRNRLAALNPDRTTLVRGVLRPGILVESSESPVSPMPANVFVLRWKGTSMDDQHPLPLVEQTCEIAYATEGTDAHGGLDRGRLLTQMDRELASMLRMANTAKRDYTQTPPVTLGTRIFWTEPKFDAVASTHDRLSRSAKVTILSYEEAGER